MDSFVKAVLFVLLLELPLFSAQQHSRFCEENKLSKNTFTYILKNVLQEPTFNLTAKLVLEGNSPFIHYMKKAMDLCTYFTGMEAKYYAEDGWFIQSLNGVKDAYSTNGTYWSVLNKYGKFLSIGVSNFKPNHNDVITLNFTDVYPH